MPPAAPVTPVSTMAMFWAFGTPVQLTVTTLPLLAVVAGCPPQVAELTVTGAGNVTTMGWLPFAPPVRDSIPSGPLSGRLISKSPTEPCSLASAPKEASAAAR